MLFTNNASGYEDEPGVFQTVHPWVRRVWNSVSFRIDSVPLRRYSSRSSTLFSVGRVGASAARIAEATGADILHLHWIAGGFIDVRSLAKVEQQVVWTIRDLWPVTGGCHHPGLHGCRRFERSCGKCPRLGSTDERDLSTMCQEMKRACLPRGVVAVCPTGWIASEVGASAVMRGVRTEVIPNCVDTEVFYPMSQADARRELGIRESGPLVLAGARDLADPYKGMDLLAKALEHVRRPLGVMVVGKGQFPKGIRADCPIIHMGVVGTDRLLRLLYCAADVFVSPSRMESFGKMMAEAQACGVPVVAFDACGICEIVRHLETGWIASAFDVDGLARGIEWALENRGTTLSASARQWADSRFSLATAASRHTKLYAALQSERTNRMGVRVSGAREASV